MIKKLVSTSVVIAAAISLSACSQGMKDHHKKHSHMMFSKMDLNSDNVVTKEEFNTFNNQKFDSMDLNKDGKICEGEFKKYIECHMKNDKAEAKETKPQEAAKVENKDVAKEVKATKKTKAKKAKTQKAKAVETKADAQKAPASN